MILTRLLKLPTASLHRFRNRCSLCKIQNFESDRISDRFRDRSGFENISAKAVAVAEIMLNQIEKYEFDKNQKFLTKDEILNLKNAVIELANGQVKGGGRRRCHWAGWRRRWR